MQMMQWRQANPEAGAIEREKAVAEIGARILKGITQPGGEMSEVVTPQAGQGGAGNPFGARTQPTAPEAPAKPSAPPAEPQGQAPVYDDTGRELIPAQPATPPSVPPAATPRLPPTAAPVQTDAYNSPQEMWDDLPAAAKSVVERRAAESKMPLQQYLQGVYDKAVGAGRIVPSQPQPKAPGRQSMVTPDGTPIEPASIVSDAIERTPKLDQAPTDEESIRNIQSAFERALTGTGAPRGGYSMTVLKDDPKASRILDFVAGPESGGNYNAYFGNAGSTRELSGMTVDQVRMWSMSRGTASSATGRYQFMAATLKGLQKEMGIPGDAKFTPELQDRMAIHLLERRGYSQWKAGEITDAQFANNLALEWAALPNFDETSLVVLGEASILMGPLNLCDIRR